MLVKGPHGGEIIALSCFTLQWCHNDRHGVSNHQPHDYLLNRLFTNQRKHQSPGSLTFVRGFHRRPVSCGCDTICGKLHREGNVVFLHYSGVITSLKASLIRNVSNIYSTVCSRTSKKTSKLRITGLCEGNSPVTGEFPAQRASNAEKVSFWWRHHGKILASSYPESCLFDNLQRKLMMKNSFKWRHLCLSKPTRSTTGQCMVTVTSQNSEPNCIARTTDWYNQLHEAK